MVNDKKELLIGCGSRREKVIHDGNPEWNNLTTLDINRDHKPDIVWDLCNIPYSVFEDNTFDEIHAYEVLEHTGSQGDYKFFFAQFSEFWRILKPGGFLMATCPNINSPWVWGDPSHTRVIQKESLIFLDQSEYTRQIGKTSMSDFRYIYKADFKCVHLDFQTDDTLKFALQAVKPSRLVM